MTDRQYNNVLILSQITDYIDKYKEFKIQENFYKNLSETINEETISQVGI